MYKKKYIQVRTHYNLCFFFASIKHHPVYIFLKFRYDIRKEQEKTNNMAYFIFLLHLRGYLNTLLNVQENGLQNPIK